MRCENTSSTGYSARVPRVAKARDVEEADLRALVAAATGRREIRDDAELGDRCAELIVRAGQEHRKATLLVAALDARAEVVAEEHARPHHDRALVVLLRRRVRRGAVAEEAHVRGPEDRELSCS